MWGFLRRNKFSIKPRLVFDTAGGTTKRRVPHPPGFPVRLGGVNEPHAAFLKESRTRCHGWGRAVGNPGPLRSWQRVGYATVGIEIGGIPPFAKSAKDEAPGDLVRCRGQEMPRFISRGSATPADDFTESRMQFDGTTKLHRKSGFGLTPIAKRLESILNAGVTRSADPIGFARMAPKDAFRLGPFSSGPRISEICGIRDRTA